MALDISLTPEWCVAHPHAFVGLLEVSDVDNARRCHAHEHQKRALEIELRSRYGGLSRADLVSLPVLCDYVRYYKSFKKTYHVQLQLESIAMKGKPLPDISPLVDSNFMAELRTLVLTAGHDADKLVSPICIDVSRPGDAITQMSGSVREIPVGDMLMRDASGVSCCVIHGQDNRSAISARTRNAFYLSFAPPGVPRAAVESQLEGILSNVRACAPDCVVRQQRVLCA